MFAVVAVGGGGHLRTSRRGDVHVRVSLCAPIGVSIVSQADRAGTRYKGTVHAFQDIIRTEGVRGLWKGWGPNVQRAYIVNAVELATYDQAKEVRVSTLPSLSLGGGLFCFSLLGPLGMQGGTDTWPWVATL